MQRSFARFTIGTMMGLIAVSGILSWLITGLVRYGTGLFGYPPLCLGSHFSVPLHAVDHLPIASGWDVRDRQPAPSRNDEPSQSVEKAQVRQASLRSAVRETLPFPHLPTRYWLARPPTSYRGAAADQRDVLPMPPVPSKVSPGEEFSVDYGDTVSARSVRSGNDPVWASVNPVRVVW